jgi:DNA-binding PadR family transcriptional regulator
MENIMSDHFTIGLDVEKARLADVLQKLDVMPGIATIHLQLTKGRAPVPTPTMTLPPVKHRMARPSPVIRAGALTVRGAVSQALMHGPMHANLLRNFLESRGMSPHSLPSALTKMLSNRVIKRVGPGTYALTSIGKRKYGGDAKSTDVVSNPKNKKGLRFLVLNELNSKDMGQDEVKEMFLDHGFSVSNVYNLVANMRAEGLIQKVDNTYSITDQGRLALDSQVVDVEPNETVHNSNSSLNGEIA